MSYRANYKRAVCTAMKVLEDHGIDRIPVDLEKILEPHAGHIRLQKYSEIERKMHLSSSDARRNFGSDAGSCVYDPAGKKFIIFYNDHTSKPRQRFTIAHEMGHYFLGHHQIQRWLDPEAREQDYVQFERECNLFASTLLCPSPKVLEVAEGQDFPEYQVEVLFDVSSQAAWVCLSSAPARLKYYDERMTAYALGLQRSPWPTSRGVRIAVD